MGKVAAQAHQNGSMISATSPSRMKAIQNIFFCMEGIVRGAASRENVTTGTVRLESTPFRRLQWKRPTLRKGRARAPEPGDLVPPIGPTTLHCGAPWGLVSELS